MSETRETYNAGNQDRPELESVITQRLTFADGSEIVVTVKAPPGDYPPALLSGAEGLKLLNADLATRHYYAYLLERLNLIETISKGPGD